MYQVGDLIVYGNTGVCRISGLTTPNLPGADCKKEYYVLEPLFQDGTIYSPVDNTRVHIRPVISKEQAEELIAMIPSLQTHEFYSAGTQQLAEHYQSFFSSHNCSDLLELIMSIYAKKQYMIAKKHKFGQIDERFMRKAEDLLYGELSVALGIEPKEIPAYIEQHICNA